MIRDILKEMCQRGVKLICLEWGCLNEHAAILEINLDENYNYDNDYIRFAMSEKKQIVIENCQICDYEFNNYNELFIKLTRD
jgi:hypothetical protein